MNTNKELKKQNEICKDWGVVQEFNNTYSI